MKKLKTYTETTAGDLYDFFSQYPEEQKITPEILLKFQEYVRKQNEKNRVYKWRAKQKEKLKCSDKKKKKQI